MKVAQCHAVTQCHAENQSISIAEFRGELLKMRDIA